MITDWDMGVGVEESPIQIVSPIKLGASLNRLSYDVSGSVTGQAKLTLYSADGRKVLEETIQGKGIWTPSSQPSSPSSHRGGSRFYLTDLSPNFRTVGERFLGEPMQDVIRVSVSRES